MELTLAVRRQVAAARVRRWRKNDREREVAATGPAVRGERLARRCRSRGWPSLGKPTDLAVFTSVKDLTAAIETYIDAWNERCARFIPTKHRPHYWPRSSTQEPRR